MRLNPSRVELEGERNGGGGGGPSGTTRKLFSRRARASSKRETGRGERDAVPMLVIFKRSCRRLLGTCSVTASIDALENIISNQFGAKEKRNYSFKAPCAARFLLTKSKPLSHAWRRTRKTRFPSISLFPSLPLSLLLRLTGSFFEACRL